MSNNFLSQEEIDALLNSSELSNDLEQDEQNLNASLEENMDKQLIEQLTEMDMDALGEIGNISMGSAATALSQLVNQRVNITTPQVFTTTPAELVKEFQVPFMIIDVTFTEGLSGSNLFIIRVSDAAIIADLMMSGDGLNPNPELSELHASAVGEAMNQMMGSAATSMTTIFQKSVVISPPQITAVNYQQDPISFPWAMDQEVVIVSFKMEIGTLINSELMQIIPTHVAKEETEMLLGTPAPVAEPVLKQEVVPEVPINEGPMSQEEIDSILSGGKNSLEGEQQPFVAPIAYTPDIPANSPKNIDLILDVPLNISVILGRTKKPIKEVLNLIPGSIVELEKLAEEPVEILVNGKLIAHGEVVVVNENFGIKIVSIDSPAERINNLR